MVQAHQPGEAVFRSILPEEIDWKPFPASSLRLPPKVPIAVRTGSANTTERDVMTNLLYLAICIWLRL